MSLLFKYLEIFFVIFLATFNTSGSCLEAIDAGKLPKPIHFLHSYYDGGESDEIYLFGGVTENSIGNNYNIYSFNISTHTIKTIGEIPSDIELFSRSYVIRSSKSDSSQNLLLLYYLIPQYVRNLTLIYLINVTDGTIAEILPLPFSLDGPSYSQTPNGDIFFFGVSLLGNSILKLDLESSETITWEIVGTLQQGFGDQSPPSSVTVRFKMRKLFHLGYIK